MGACLRFCWLALGLVASLVGLITQRSLVQIQPPQPTARPRRIKDFGAFLFLLGGARRWRHPTRIQPFPSASLAPAAACRRACCTAPPRRDDHRGESVGLILSVSP